MKSNIFRHNEDGSYTYGYEGADGSFKIETKLATGEVKGKYGYVDEAGKVKVVEYGANKYGFQPSGEGITVPPPTLVDETTGKDALLDYEDNVPAPRPQVHITWYGYMCISGISIYRYFRKSFHLSHEPKNFLSPVHSPSHSSSPSHSTTTTKKNSISPNPNPNITNNPCSKPRPTSSPSLSSSQDISRSLNNPRSNTSRTRTSDQVPSLLGLHPNVPISQMPFQLM